MILPAGSSGLLTDRLQQNWPPIILSAGGIWLTRAVCPACGRSQPSTPPASTLSEFEFIAEQCKCIFRRWWVGWGWGGGGTICTVCCLRFFFPSLSLLCVCRPSSCMEGAGKALTDGQTDRRSRWLQHHWVPINPWLSLRLGETCTHWPNHGATPKPIWQGDSHRWQFVARQVARVSRHTNDARQGSL